MQRLNPWRDAPPYLGCGEQAGRLFPELDNVRYDDQWRFEWQQRYLPPHQWLEGRSSNPNDPVLVIDPFYNEIQEAPERR